MDNMNLKRCLKSSPLRRLKYGLVYDCEVVYDCGNNLGNEGRFLYDRIDIRRLDEMIKYNDWNCSSAFVNLRSKELVKGIGHGKHADWMCVREYMEAYEAGLPVPPIIVSGTRINDGNHRLYAQYKLGYERIDAFIEIKDH
jgi:hypothetical protein